MAKLVVEFNWQHIDDILSAAVSGRSVATMVDVEGKRIAQTEHWFDQKTSRLIKVNAKTSDYLGLGWRLEIAQPQSEVMAPVHQMTSIFIGLLVASVLLAALLGYRWRDICQTHWLS